jgi:hypothetical protein
VITHKYIRCETGSFRDVDLNLDLHPQEVLRRCLRPVRRLFPLAFSGVVEAKPQRDLLGRVFPGCLIDCLHTNMPTNAQAVAASGRQSGSRLASRRAILTAARLVYGTILYCVQTPSKGCDDTVYADTQSAFATLPASLRRRLVTRNCKEDCTLSAQIVSTL